MDIYIPEETLVSGFKIDFNIWLVSLFWLAIIAIGLFVIRKLILFIASKTSYNEHRIFLVRLPKEKPGEEQKEMDVQHLREEIAQAETTFSAIGGLRAQRNLKSYIGL